MALLNPLSRLEPTIGAMALPSLNRVGFRCIRAERSINHVVGEGYLNSYLWNACGMPRRIPRIEISSLIYPTELFERTPSRLVDILSKFFDFC
jgi:hypothetical protein